MIPHGALQLWMRRCAVLAALLALGCERPAADHAAAGSGAGELRIVSLSPGVSATLHELGLGGAVVGRTPWCRAVPHAPAVGSLLDIDAEALVRARPTLVFVQPAAQGLPAALVDIASDRGWTVVPVPLESLEDCRRLAGIVVQACAPRCDEATRAGLDAAERRIQEEFNRSLAPLPAAHGVRALAVSGGDGTSDLLAFGGDTYLEQALTRLGFTPCLGRAGYQSIGAEDLARLHPDVLLVVGGGAALAHSAIVPSGTRVVLVDDPALLQPGGGIARALGSMRDALAGGAQ